MKKLSVILLSFSMLISFMLSGCSQKKASEDEDTIKARIEEYSDVDFIISADELESIRKNDDVLIFDCNKPEVYEKGHIPGAVNIGIQPFSDISGKIGEEGWGTVVDKDEMAKKLKELGIDNEKTVVFYSDVMNGPGADGRAVWQLRMAGMDNVKFLNGGYTYWVEKGYETTKEESKAVPTDKDVKLSELDKSSSATKDYVYENLDKEVILDVRTDSEYGGSQNAGEPRGGHIKGAENLLWQDLMYSNGVIKSKEEIKDIMAEYGVKPEDSFCVY